jgi:hypothetical protein
MSSKWYLSRKEGSEAPEHFVEADVDISDVESTISIDDNVSMDSERTWFFFQVFMLFLGLT